MDKSNVKKESWESLSSAFSSIDISVSQDSCYSSDETSATSAMSHTAASSAVPSFMSAAASSLPPFFNSMLKKPCAVDEEGSESESGYGSDAFEYESDLSIVDADAFSEGDDDICYVPEWDETSKQMETQTDVDNSIDDSFISFESVVRFDSNVQYIETPETEETDTTPEKEMTFHEIMEIARNSGSSRFLEENSDTLENDGESETASEPEEHTCELVDLDKRLFAAYMNGMNGIADRCRPQIRRHVDDIRHGRLCSPFLENDSSSGVYLDQILHHVIGVFPNLLNKEEIDELVKLREEKVALKRRKETSQEAVQKCTETMLHEIEGLLVDRLAKGNVEVGPDETSFMATGVAYALENWSMYARRGHD